MKHLVQIASFTESDRQYLEHVFDSTQESFSIYADLLFWWNSKLNLLSRNVSRETILEHIRHSLWMVKSKWVSEANSILDTGTGGGLPGIPLALALPELDLVLNDVVQKKGMVLKDMIPKLDLSGRVRVEIKDVGELDQKPDLVVTKHAFKIDDLLQRVRKERCRKFVFLKGYHEVEKEIEGIEERLSVTIYKLDELLYPDAFYEGKGVVEIERLEADL